MDQKLTLNSSLELLIKGIQLAQSKGAYTLEESSIFLKVILFLTKKPEKQEKKVKKKLLEKVVEV